MNAKIVFGLSCLALSRKRKRKKKGLKNKFYKGNMAKHQSDVNTVKHYINNINPCLDLITLSLLSAAYKFIL